MASIPTINEWIEQLASSILIPSPAATHRAPRKKLEAFRRRVRHHSYARANQFDVNDRLDGLEEKFQILNRDDISDALHSRRVELREHYDRWIPDILDLLLRLSDNPLRTTNTESLSNVASLSEPPASLKWADIEVDDPFDTLDPIWQRPEFSDLSSDEDEVEVTTATTSPASVKQREQSSGDHTRFSALAFETPDIELTETALRSIHAFKSSLSASYTEIQLVRQILLMVQGYSCSLFEMHHGRVQLSSRSGLKNVLHETLQELVGQLGAVRHDLDVMNQWIQQARSPDYVQAIKQMVEGTVQKYLSHICALDEELLHPRDVQIASLIKIAAQIEELGLPLKTLGRWVRRVDGVDAITSLDMLYEMVCELYFTNDAPGTNLVVPMFLRAFEVYTKPIQLWLERGVLTPKMIPFFVHSKPSASFASTLWHDSFELDLEGLYRAPSFFKPFAQDIFACGKTVAFINRVRRDKTASSLQHVVVDDLLTAIQSLASDPIIPFSTAFLNALRSYYSSALASATSTLRQLLDTECGMSRTLDAFEYLFLRKNGVLLDRLEAGMFSRIDKCMDSWNDRFLVADIVKDVYAEVDCVDIESITVHSVHTSSRSMQSRRRSVRIFEALAIDYALPWPVANIISKTSLASYRRVSLHLLQIRRAKYVLDRIAYTHVNSTAVSEDSRDQQLTQATTFMLIQFANTLYDHFTTGTTLPMTTKMRRDLHTAITVDAMIAVHETYIANLEFACLTAKQLTVLRETLIGLLDMCIRFTDLVASPASATHRHRSGSIDFETGSFVSAQSRHRRRTRKRSTSVAGPDQDSMSSDDEDEDDPVEGEGYSSFIVLDEDTSVVQEIRKLQTRFRRQLDFFVAGLRGVGRGGGTVEEFEMLAGRLQW